MIRTVTRGIEVDEETVTEEGHENDKFFLIVSIGEKDTQTLLPAKARIINSSFSDDSAEDVCLPFNRDISRGINARRDKKIAIGNDTVMSTGVEVSGKRKKKEKREKKERKQNECKRRSKGKREDKYNKGDLEMNVRLDQISKHSSSAMEKAKIIF